jgi:ATP-dependent DNA helicase RecG
LIFDNRVEIISPGKLPNNLTVEKIKRGVSVKRNHTLASFAFDLIPYRGIGSGIIRALQHYPDIEFIHDVDLEQFKAIIKRPELP